MKISEAVQHTRAVVADVVAPHAERVDREGAWPEEGLRAMQASGLGGLVVPVSAGGLGLGLEALTAVCAELGQSCASTAICFGMHCVGSAVIAAKATDDQRIRFLEPIARGQHLTTLALSEPGTGAHFYLPETKLTQQTPDRFVVDGSKSFITNGGHADSYVISASAADPDAPPGTFSCLVAPREARGLRWRGTWTGWGMRGNSAISADFDGVEIARRDLLGTEGDETWYVFNVVAPYFLVAMAGTYLGVVTAAFAEARKHLISRTYAHTGASLTSSAVLQHRAGVLWAEIERTRALVVEASRRADTAGEDALPMLCSAKAEVACCAERVVAECMTMMGGHAYADDAPIHRHYRDARAAHVMSPTTDLLRTWTGRAVLGLPLLGA